MKNIPEVNTMPDKTNLIQTMGNTMTTATPVNGFLTWITTNSASLTFIMVFLTGVVAIWANIYNARKNKERVDIQQKDYELKKEQHELEKQKFEQEKLEFMMSLKSGNQQ